MLGESWFYFFLSQVFRLIYLELGSFGPILFKQVPYTMAKFGVYEVVAVRVSLPFSQPRFGTVDHTTQQTPFISLLVYRKS